MAAVMLDDAINDDETDIDIDMGNLTLNNNINIEIFDIAKQWVTLIYEYDARLLNSMINRLKENDLEYLNELTLFREMIYYWIINRHQYYGGTFKTLFTCDDTQTYRYINEFIQEWTNYQGGIMYFIQEQNINKERIRGILDTTIEGPRKLSRLESKAKYLKYKNKYLKLKQKLLII